MDSSSRIVLTGGAGLVGQNLTYLLRKNKFQNIVIIDKHAANNNVARRLFPEVAVIDADLAVPGQWEAHLDGAATIVMLQAQISGLAYDEFKRNTLDTTDRVVAAAKRFGVPYLVHVSSSVVNSRADDFYCQSKRAQETMVLQSGIKCAILRPTLMFGWFDRKHLGWLARFMRRTPVFPIPGNGRYIRQALFELDFCMVILACIEREITGTYNISGLERVHYIDLIRDIKNATEAGAPIVRIPYWLFWALLRVYALFDRNPPFTTQQLAALVIPEEFELIDWPGIFNVKQTPLHDALKRTFQEKPYCDVVLEF